MIPHRNSRLTVVTGPAGVDIGPAVAAIGARLNDGLTVRVIDSIRHGGDGAHTSPDPFHHEPLADPRVAQGPAQPSSVRLRYLPSAWQDPQTNLGVVFTGHAHSALKDDLHTMQALGLDPSHRLTVQPLSGPLRHDYTFPSPVEVGDLDVIARDSVLRAGGHVLIEAGDGMTHLEAIAALRTPPWAPWIGRVDLWTVFDVTTMIEQSAPGERINTDRVTGRVADDLTRLGALINGTTDKGVMQAFTATSRVVILGLDDAGATAPHVDHEQVGPKVIERTGTGVNVVFVGLGSIVATSVG